MKPYIKINEEWDYDEMKNREVLLFIVPNDFNLDNALVIEFLKTRSDCKEISEKNGMVYFKLRSCNDKKFHPHYETISSILDFGYFQSDFLEWLEWAKGIEVQLFELL